MTTVQHKIRGTVKRVLSLGAGGGAIVLLRTGQSGTVRVVIPHDKISQRPYVGEVLTAVGSYEFHPVYEEQLQASVVLAEHPTVHELAGLLGSHPLFAQITPRRARHYARKDGRALLNSVEIGDVGRLLELGMELREAVSVIEQWRRYWSEKRLSQLLIGGGLKPTRAQELLSIYGHTADRTVGRDPFTLIPFYPWKLVDSFAEKTQASAVNPTSRMIGAAESVVFELQSQGRYVATRDEVTLRLRKLLDSSMLPSKAIDAAVDARRLFSWKSSNGEMIQSIGARILFCKLLARLKDFSTVYVTSKASQGNVDGESATTGPIEQLVLPCTSSETVAARTNRSEGTLHIVPTLAQRDAINASTRGKSITYNELLARLPHPTRKSSRTVLLHNCDGLDPLALSKILHRLPLGGRIWLCFSSHLPSETLRTLEAMDERLPPNLFTFNSSLSNLLTGPTEGIATLARALSLGSSLPIANVQPGVTILSGAAVIECGSRTDVFNEVLAAFYAGRSNGRTVIVAETANEREQFNTHLHNEWVAYLTQARRQSPLIWLREHESATIDEPIVCRSNLRRINILRGSIGRIVDVPAKPNIVVHEGRVLTLTVLVQFEGASTTALSTEEATQLSLAYALPPQLIHLAEWDHIVSPLSHADSIDSESSRQIAASARRSVLFIRSALSHKVERLTSPTSHRHPSTLPTL